MSRESTGERQVPFSVVDDAVHLLDDEVERGASSLKVRVEGHLHGARLRAALAEASQLARPAEGVSLLQQRRRVKGGPRSP